jgi:CheY-like chemotaxis protein
MTGKNAPTVLVVDDDPLILNLVKEQLSDYEYQPILAISGEEALEIAKKNSSIDLLLTDIIMPGINGMDLAKQFSTLYPHVKVLFMSGFTLPSSLYSIAGKGVAYLQKPFCKDALLDKMKFVLG